MPGPEPGAVWVEDEGARFHAYGNPYLWTGQLSPNRRKRMVRMLHLVRHGWRCRWCREDIPQDRRTDAEFCRERCRKAAARQMRKFRRRVVEPDRYQGAAP